MDSGRWQKMQDLFHRAVGLDKTALRAFLDETCAGDEALRSDVESLLAADPGVTAFFGTARATAADVDEDRYLGERIGPYRIVRRLGEGGMGVVYQAARADGEFKHRVAIKLMRAPWLGPQLLERFLTERQILAQLEHPNIARLLDGGTTALGQPYLVMEYVQGEPIDDYCAARRLSTRWRLELVLQICEAVAHAHRQLVVHRDLKPANILVAEESHRRPGMAGPPRVKLLDFGIAKLLDAGPEAPALTTAQGPVLTPEYASPEQVRGEPAGTASDVYSLGVLLYQLLSGAPPYRFDTKTPQEIERVVCETPPARPSTAARAPDATSSRLRRELAGDLDAIVLTALRKQPGNRYPSVESLAGDIRNYLESRPISAKPASRRYVAGKFFRRHRAGVTATAGACLALAAGAVMAVWGMLQAQTEALRSEQTSAFVMNMLSSIDPDYARGADTELIRRVLEDAAARAPVELARQPSVLSDLQYTIGSAYAQLGAYDRAREHLILAARMREGATGTARRLEPQIALARIDDLSGDWEAGLERIESVLERAAHLPPESRVPLEAMRVKAALLLQRNDNDAAEPIVRELIERTANPGDAAIINLHLESLFLMAWIHSNLGRFEQAHHRYEQIREVAAGWDDPAAAKHVAGALNDQAVAYLRQQDYVKAEPLLRDSLALREQRYGTDHPRLVGVLNNLASSIRQQGRPEEARPMLERTLALAREAYGPGQPNTLIIQNNLGNLLREQGEVEAAAELQRTALAAAGSAFPDTHPMQGNFRLALGQSELALGNAAAAEALLQEAVTRFTEAHGEEHHQTAEARNSLAEALDTLGP